LRVKLGSDICRLFYFYWQDKIYVITSGYIKKTRKLEQAELKRAERIMNQFKEK
jgi:phage-related protein